LAGIQTLPILPSLDLKPGSYSTVSEGVTVEGIPAALLTALPFFISLSKQFFRQQQPDAESNQTVSQI